MFFKKKCPNCGAKNDKERMACIECGAPFASGQVEGQAFNVSTRRETQAMEVEEWQDVRRKHMKEEERQEDIAWQCDECGSEITENDKSCPNCGVEFEEED